jgi:down-regulator of transcription 1
VFVVARICDIAALDNLGFGSYKDEAQTVLQEAKAVAAKKRRASTKLENLGIPEDELYRQQQELFAKAKLEQAQLEQQEMQRIQQQLQQQALLTGLTPITNDDDDYN